MSFRAVVMGFLGLLVVVTPYITVSTTCAPERLLASADPQAQPSGSPSKDAGCGSTAHTAPNLATRCSACGVALLPDPLFLPEEAIVSYESPIAPLAIADALPSYWHPPA